MSLETEVAKREQKIISEVESKQAIHDKTGKGLATESIIERELINPFLSPRFGCIKGAVVTSSAPEQQSPAIDRVIFDKTAAPPLIYDLDHSIFAIESVCGLVEITMSLDTAKLRDDIKKMAPIKAMTERWYLEPVSGTTTQAIPRQISTLSPRSNVIGLPADPHWAPKTIAVALREIQDDLGQSTHVHGLYVLGIGFFQTIPREDATEESYRIQWWSGPDRLFRFSNSLRQGFDRWFALPPNWTVNLSNYVQGESETLAESTPNIGLQATANSLRSSLASAIGGA